MWVAACGKKADAAGFVGFVDSLVMLGEDVWMFMDVSGYRLRFIDISDIYVG
jgi:hypothetical protein